MAGVCGVVGDGATSCYDHCSGRSTAHTYKVSRRCVIACGLPGAARRLKQMGTGGSGEVSLLYEKKRNKSNKTSALYEKKQNKSNKTLALLSPENEVLTLTCVDSDVLDESCCASGGIVAVAALELSVIGPLKTIHQDP